MSMTYREPVMVMVMPTSTTVQYVPLSLDSPAFLIMALLPWLSLFMPCCLDVPLLMTVFALSVSLFYFIFYGRVALTAVPLFIALIFSLFYDLVALTNPLWLSCLDCPLVDYFVVFSFPLFIILLSYCICPNIYDTLVLAFYCCLTFCCLYCPFLYGLVVLTIPLFVIVSPRLSHYWAFCFACKYRIFYEFLALTIPLSLSLPLPWPSKYS